MTEMGAPTQSTRMVAGSWAALYESEVGWVWNTLRRLGTPSAELDDLTHDVFLVAHRARDRFDPTRPVRPWLMGIAFRVLSDFRRLKRHTSEVLGADLGDLAAEDNLEAGVADRQARALLLGALDRLEPDRRAVFVAHDLEGIAMPQIAEAFDVPLNTAYSRLRLARENLTVALEAFKTTA